MSSANCEEDPTMLDNDAILVAQGDKPCRLLLNQANRHGLIAGASGTGKTVTFKVMAEGFSEAGVPVFMADVKGDVTGLAQAGEPSEGLSRRMESLGLDPAAFKFSASPVREWDMLGDGGIPVRVTVSDMGPVLLSRLLGLTEVQSGVLDIAFRVADDKDLLLIDLKDLRSMLSYVSEHAKEYRATYGNVSSQSVGAILRRLISVEDQGGDVFFGEPALDLSDWFQCAPDGRGYVNILNATKLVQSPQVYAMFLLWMLTTIYERLPEVGDLDKPKFVFFFDEAHLLFDDMPEALTDKIVQVVKLVRSKGVGVYFITQSPSDVPDEVLAQLSNRVQHGLRAYTPSEQKAVRAAAASFRPNPAFDSEQALGELGTGEALISFLDEEGRPSVVERAKVLPPQCRMGAADASVMKEVLSSQAPLMEKYGAAVDRESAFEQLSAQSAVEAEQARLAEERKQLEKERAALEKSKQKEEARRQREEEKEEERRQREAEKQQERQRKQLERAAGSILGTFGREATRQIVRGIFGTRR
ncbi:MAG: helicase HerA-like domain-containing protein [Tractidigestivibacter sp.]|uniref:helicase HerA-like domain-containing protein n=1 Tax=Tractidigestivibacter sp. TaxID=2847320 RepID=UPI003D9031C8